MGKLIVFEGIDGSGKSTQFELLCARLNSENRGFMRVTFPRYDEPSSALIKMYLEGGFGDDPDSVNAYAAASFFAVDRYASYKQAWGSYYENGGIVVTDRYTTSNAIHQGAKLPQEQRESYFKWLYDFEFSLMELPAPDLVLYISIDHEHAAQRLALRQAETGTRGDIHEKDSSYLSKCAMSGRHAASFYGWRVIECFSGDIPRGIEEIHDEIYSLITNQTGLF